jgi:hypothetical protein
MHTFKKLVLSTIIATTTITSTAIAEDFQVYAEIGPSISEFSSPVLSNIHANMSLGGAYKIDSMFSVGLRANIQGKNYKSTAQGADASTPVSDRTTEVNQVIVDQDANNQTGAVTQPGNIKPNSTVANNTTVTSPDFFSSIQAEGFVKVYDEDDLSVKVGVGLGLGFEDTKITNPKVIGSLITQISYELKDEVSLSLTGQISVLHDNLKAPKASITLGLSYDL